MNTIKLNTIGDVVKQPIGGSGSANIKNQSKEVVITERGTTTVTPDSGYTGLDRVKIKVNFPIEIENYLTVIAWEDDFTVSIKGGNDEIFYCIDGSGDWIKMKDYEPTPPINEGQMISFKGEGGYNSSWSGLQFGIDKDCEVLGNVMSLVFGDNAKWDGLYGVYLGSLFYGNKICDAQNLILPAIYDLPPYCYAGMFRDCTNLYGAPKLPAKTLSESCYGEMFSGCTNLEYVPELAARNLARDCCNLMFRNCTSLQEVPTLEARELVVGCYKAMFAGCTSLSRIEALFKNDPPSGALHLWTQGVSPNGTFVKHPNATWDITGESGIPEGWTVEVADI